MMALPLESSSGEEELRLIEQRVCLIHRAFEDELCGCRIPADVCEALREG